MTWQDELQHLDAELAAGRISAEEYRQRRDALSGRSAEADADDRPEEESTRTVEPIAGEEPTVASDEPTRTAQPTAGDQPTRNVEPIAGEEPTKQVGQPQPAKQDPFPPPFSWSEAAKQNPRPPAPGQGTTPVVPPFGQQPPAAGGPGGSGPGGVTPPPPPQWGPPQAQWPQPPAWGPVETTGTPWGDGLPGSSEPGNAPWMRQGPEVFETAGKSGKGKLVAGLAFGAVLLIAAVVAAVLLFTGRGEEPAASNPPAAPPPPPATTPSTPAPTSQPLPEPPAVKPAPPGPAEAVVAVPGPRHPWSGHLDVPAMQGEKAALLPPAVNETARQHGFVDGWFNGTVNVSPMGAVIALKLPDPNAARTVVEKYLAEQRGLTEVEDLSYRGVPVVAAGPTFRTAYAAHNYAIVLGTSGDPANVPAAGDAFKALLAQQLAHTPPTVRE